MSIPFAIKNQFSKGITQLNVIKHIMKRGISLLIIGVFIVNYELANSSAMVISKYKWCFLMACSVFLTWMNWSKSPVPQKWHLPVKLIGVVGFVALAFIYRGGADGEQLFATHWWGILGLIGWAYMSNSLAYLFSRGNLYVNIGLFVLFNVLAILNFAGPLSELPVGLSYFGTVIQGYIPAFTSAGVLLSVLLIKCSTKPSKHSLYAMLSFGVFNVVFALLMEPYYWMIYKLAMSNAISIFLFVAVFFCADIKGKTSWANIISPAGTATLTCYLIPYFLFSLRQITDIRFPDVINDGLLGLVVSLACALLIVLFTGLMQKRGYSLKL